MSLTVPAIGFDPNGAGWYVLRYARDFDGPGTVPGLPLWQQPALGPELFYDDIRHVLELLPVPGTSPIAPLPGLAVDVTGEIYRVNERGELVRRHCDGCEAPLLCEPGVLVLPAGLALDRRGFLYVADPGAHRVVVLDPDDGSVVGVLVEGLKEPVDVAISPTGRIYVADRVAGEISRWSPRFSRRGAFKAISPEGLPANPEPIQVFVESDGSIGVVDANHPRILRFSAVGAGLGDREFQGLIRNLPVDRVAQDALSCLYGAETVRIIAGACLGPCPVTDGGARLAEVHRILRLLRLRLNRSFHSFGTFASAALDGGLPGMQWHRIEIDADLPPGTWLKVATVTSDDPTALDDPEALVGVQFEPFELPADRGVPPTIPSDLFDRLVLSPPGRYLRLRLVLGSNGLATPSVRAIRVFLPRVSYLDLLPRVFRRDPDAERFLERFLALFEHLLTATERRYEEFSRQINLDAAPAEILIWLAALVDLVFEPNWPLERRRALLREAVSLYAIRGTTGGIARYLEIYTGSSPVLIEHWQERVAGPAPLGRTGQLLGLGPPLVSPLSGSAVAALDALRAHRFTVYVQSDDPAADEALLAVVRRIVETNKPAHTSYELRVMRPGSTVGETRVGFDAILGGREAPRVKLGGCNPGANEPDGAAIGRDAILGERRPEYARPLGLRL
jgi:phage tail-like protein